VAKLVFCAFCEKATPDPCGDDWLPGYWDVMLGRELDSPVCPDCAAERLTHNPDTGEYQFPRTTAPEAFAGPAPADG